MGKSQSVIGLLLHPDLREVMRYHRKTENNDGISHHLRYAATVFDLLES